MASRVRRQMAVLVAAGLALFGCSEDLGAQPSSAEQLADRLITPDDFVGAWAIHPSFGDTSVDGVVDDEASRMLPGFDMCDEAGDESHAAADALRWKAFRQLDLDVDDPIQMPGDRSGHMVFAQEFLTSGPAGEMTVAFDALRDGVLACLGDIPAGEEGPGVVSEITLPDLGDERVGWLTELAEAGGWAQWRVYESLVRRGSTLVKFTFVEIHSTDVEPMFGADDVTAMAETVVAGL